MWVPLLAEPVTLLASAVIVTYLTTGSAVVVTTSVTAAAVTVTYLVDALQYCSSADVV